VALTEHVNVNVTLPALGNVGMVKPGLCSAATVGAAGHTAPPAAAQLTVEQVSPLTPPGSVTTALFAANGPLFVTTML
jgi:hypothetical protein